MTDSAPLLSIIIPTLNEAEALPMLLADIRSQRGVSLEVLVGDGGSSDGTETAALNGGARFIPARRGRGAQMNEAARLARGVYLLFLHADSRLHDPQLLAEALQALREALWLSPQVAGHFTLAFQRTTPGHDLRYAYIEAKTLLNRPGTTNGDQGLLLTRQWFEQLGGFDARLPFLEDQRIAEQIRTQGRFITLPGVLTTSARRFESEGFTRRYLSMGLIMVALHCGLDDFFNRLPGLYRHHQRCGRLLLAPILLGFWATLFAVSDPLVLTQRIETIGHFLVANAWQPFCFADVFLGQLRRGGGWRLLSFFDQRLAPGLRFRPLAIVIGWITVLLWLGLVTPLLWLGEWWEGRGGKGCTGKA